MTYSLAHLEAVSPADSGRTNTSYILNFKGSKCILRISNGSTDAHVIDRNYEHELLLQASNAKLSPNIIATGKNFVASEYYENQNTLDAMSSVQMIAPALSALHMLIPKQSHTPIFEEVLKNRMSRVRDRCTDIPKNYWELEEAVLDTFASPEYSTLPTALCHLDLTPRNVLFGADGIKFIDFEMANWGPRLLDFASLSVGYGLNDEQERTLVGQYFDENPLTLDAFYKTKLCYHFRCVLWLLNQQEIEEKKKWRESDLRDLELDFQKAFICKEKISPKRGALHDQNILPGARNNGP